MCNQIEKKAFYLCNALRDMEPAKSLWQIGFLGGLMACGTLDGPSSH